MKLNFFLFILFSLILVNSLHSTGVFRLTDYSTNLNVSRNFTIPENESDYVAKISFNFTPLINLGLVSSTCGGWVLSNNTLFNSTYGWYDTFWVEDCNLKTKNSTIHIRSELWNNQIAPVWTMKLGNQTQLAGNDFGNASGVYTPNTYAFVTVYNSTSAGGKYTDIANDFVTGTKTNTIGIDSLPYSFGVAWGSADFITWTENALYRLTSNFSYVAWFKSETDGDYSFPLSQGESGGAIGAEIRHENNNKFCFQGATMGSLCSSGTMSNDTLYFVAGVNDGTSSAVYLNKTKTTGTLGSPSFSQNNPLCTGGQSYATVCHTFSSGQATQVMIIKRAISSAFVQAEVDGYDIYSNLPGNFLTVFSPSGNYTNFTIPYNFTTVTQDSNVTITSSSCGSTTINNAVVGTYYSGTLTCTNRKNGWFFFNASDNTFASLQTTNQTFYIVTGATFNLTNGGNGTALTSWTLNITNGSYTTNFTGANNPLNVEFDQFPLGSTLYYNFTPSDSHYAYPDRNNLNGQFTPSNTSFQNFTGKAWLRQDFYLSNGTLQASWIINVSWSNGSTQSYTISNGFANFSLEQFSGQTVFLNGLLFGFGNDSLTRTFNGSSPYLNYTFSVVPAGLNITFVKDINTLNQITANFTVTNGVTSYSNFSNLNPLFIPYSQLPSGVNIITFRNTSYYVNTYVATISAFSVVQLGAYLLNITNPYALSVTFYVRTNTGSAITGATVQIQQLIGGNFVTVGSGLTDGTGGITFFMDRSLVYNVVASYQSLSTSISNFVPASNQYIIYLGGNPSNYTPSFANFTFDYNPKQFQISNLSNLIGFNCSYIDSNGATLYWGLLLYASNNSGSNYSLIYSTNVTNSATGGTAPVFVNVTNYTQIVMTCFWKRSIDLSENDFNYTYQTSNYDSTLGIFGALQNLNEPQGSGVNWFIDFIVNVILIAVFGFLGILETDYGSIIYVIIGSLVALVIGFVPVITVAGMILVFVLMISKVAR